jgi:hypothetical protein
MQSCPGCLAELHPDPESAVAALTEILALGGRLFRPDGVPTFAGGASCTLLRLAPRASLVYAGADELVEASVAGLDHRAAPPLRCEDLDGTLLFRLDRYEPVDGALVATGADGAALATFLPGPDGGDSFDVRDETSAPVARFRRSALPDADFELVETGGGLLLTAARSDVELDGAAGDRWVDDQWSLSPGPDLPLRPLGGVALALAAKVLLGRPAPVRVHEPESAEGPDWEMG